MLADEVIGLAAQVHKQLEAAGGPLASIDNIRHVRGQHKRGPVPEHEGQTRSGWRNDAGDAF